MVSLRRTWILFCLLSLLTWGCALPTALSSRFFPTPTPSRTPYPTHTFTPTPTATASITPTPSRTPAPTATPTFTLIPPTATYTATPTQSPIPPTLTPGPNEITSGQDAWRLLLVDHPAAIQAQGAMYYPGVDGVFYSTYAFMRLNFACLSDAPLLSIYSQADQGLLFASNPDGIPGVTVLDPDGGDYPVTLIGPCWLAAALPRSQLEAGNYTLQFQDLPAFEFWVDGLR